MVQTSASKTKELTYQGLASPPQSDVKNEFTSLYDGNEFNYGPEINRKYELCI